MRPALPLMSPAPGHRPPAASRPSRTVPRAARPKFEARIGSATALPAPRQSRPSAATGPGISPDRGARRRLQLSLFLPPPGRADRAGPGEARADLRALGVARCRITGMRYRVVNENDIEAMLAFKLDPAIARRFGQQGVRRSPAPTAC